MESRERIIKAAIEVFAEKGKYGMRMDEIAERANINKAMVYYYYSSRENLYREVLESVMRRYFTMLSSAIEQIINDNTDHVDKLRRFVITSLDVLSHDRIVAKLVIDALASEPEELSRVMENLKKDPKLNIPKKMLDFLEDGMEKGIFRKLNPKQLLINIVAMSLFYFIAKPVATVFLDLDIEDEQAFLKERQQSVIELLLDGIVKRSA